MGRAHGRVLAHRTLNEDPRDADDEHADKVGQEKDSAPVLVGHVGKPPHVAQAHSEAKHGEDEIKPENPKSAMEMIEK